MPGSPVVRLPPLRPDRDTVSATVPVWPRTTTTDRSKLPRGGLTLTRRRNLEGDVALARARALQRDRWTLEARAAVLSPPATPAGRLPPLAAAPRTPSSPGAAAPSPPELPQHLPGSPSTNPRRAAPRMRPRSKHLTPLKLRDSCAAGLPSTSAEPSVARTRPLCAAAPVLPPPSIAERGGAKAAAPRVSRRVGKAAGASSSALPVPPALPAPPAPAPALVLPELPAARLPTLPPPSQQVPMHELTALFWGGIHDALAPSTVNEQWMAVRQLVVVA